MKKWKLQNIDKAKYIGELKGFELVVTDTAIVFGGMCNTGMLQSGYMNFEEDETLDTALYELSEELEVFYRDGKQYCNRIVCNDRMGQDLDDETINVELYQRHEQWMKPLF